MTDLVAVDRFIEEHVPDWMAELRELCAIPSVSARHEAIEPCAERVAAMLERRGLAAEVTPTAGHPVVLARGGRGGGRTMLFYNHYDVQPPEPLDLWESPPFELTERDGAVYARGAKDDKGELVARLAAVDAIRAVTGDHPCAITWIVEGEEEVGSPHFPGWVAEHTDEVGAEAAIWEEGGTEEDGRPIVRLGARGLLYVELTVKAMARDAHSGSANLLPNAAWRMIWALASIKGADERIRIPGFYDGVRKPTEREEELLAALPDSSAEYRREFGIDRLINGVTDVNRAFFEPTANVAGLGAGYQGQGSKTVIPARAVAKMDFRLVPNQDPEDILAKLRRHLDACGFGDVEIEVLGAERPGLTDPDAPLVKVMAETAEEVYGKPPTISPLIGGTTPMYLFTEQGVPVVAPGVGWGARNRAHSPNEFMRVGDFVNAARHIARLLMRFAEP